MGGKMSREKGARNERSLVMHLRLKGYDARRVIRTRAVSGFEGDVVPDVEVWENGAVKYTFESKSRKESFKSIYALYEKEKADNVYRFSVPQAPTPLLVAVGTDFEEVRKTTDVHFKSLSLDGSLNTITHMRITRLQAMLKGAQFLAIRDNGKPILFLRFWG